ncbi:hypothetical protein CEY11_12140, partial [Candidimonas nitroreducens]
MEGGKNAPYLDRIFLEPAPAARGSQTDEDHPGRRHRRRQRLPPGGRPHPWDLHRRLLDRRRPPRQRLCPSYPQDRPRARSPDQDAAGRARLRRAARGHRAHHGRAAAGPEPADRRSRPGAELQAQQLPRLLESQGRGPAGRPAMSAGLDYAALAAAAAGGQPRTVVGALLNYRQTLEQLGEAASQPPYKAPPKAPILY